MKTRHGIQGFKGQQDCHSLFFLCLVMPSTHPFHPTDIHRPDIFTASSITPQATIPSPYNKQPPPPPPPPPLP
ncbi:hypothetical protein E2C01_002247 [Portunus trituberculatus]|uniref:Uncharacterized protein n=1 Tax=Portunus trituberculatus TaxID=210409 RepID=A0A5B7CLG2_PORTR|nr:hypothetical protein [Portunus trituberculatus]